MRPDSQTSATLVVTPSAMGLRNARFAAPVRCQYSESPTTKSSTFSVCGKDDNGGVAGLGADSDNLILPADAVNYRAVRLGFDDFSLRAALLSVQRNSERHERRRDECKDFQHELPPG